ncbi:MAG: hypothetical protein HY868_16685 [Chloroflexi bacterium]|nr:hypothetical protein [Chloroflexota bacterium]
MNYGINFSGADALGSLESLLTVGGIALLLGLMLSVTVGRTLVGAILDLFARWS